LLIADCCFSIGRLSIARSVDCRLSIARSVDC
jgi:hypothetical protein